MYHSMNPGLIKKTEFISLCQLICRRADLQGWLHLDNLSRKLICSLSFERECKALITDILTSQTAETQQLNTFEPISRRIQRPLSCTQSLLESVSGQMQQFLLSDRLPQILHQKMFWTF